MNDENKTHWPTGVVVGLLLAMATLLYAASFLIRNPVELVREDYYDAGLSQQEKIDALAASSTLVEQPDVSFIGTKLNIVLPPEWAGDSSNLVVGVYRPDNGALDKRFQVEDPAKGAGYDYSKQPAGRWRVALEWDLKDIHYMTEHELHLK